MSAMLIVLLPETLRSVAGNGTIKLKGIYQPLIRTLTKDPAYMREPEPGRRKGKVTPRTFLEPLLILKDKDMMVVLGYGGVVYAIWNMLVATTTDLFKERFHLDELTLGLVFIPNGESCHVLEAIEDFQNLWLTPKLQALALYSGPMWPALS